MTSRERTLKTLRHEEPDRVPLFEIAVNNALGKHALGRQVHFYGSGSSIKAGIETQIRDMAAYKQFVEDSLLDTVEAYYKLGIDMVPILPTAFVTPINFGLGIVSIANIYDVEITKEKEHLYKITSKDPQAPGFWGTCAYAPESGTFQMVSDSINEKGEAEFERYVEYLENKNLTKIPQTLAYGLEALRKVIELNNEKYNLFLIGHGDIEYPCFVPYHALFLELLCTNNKLVHRYMRATTDSMKALLTLQLDMGVDGILACSDWCCHTGSLMSPAHFDEYLAPYLKELVDLTHRYDKVLIKHLDGNTKQILDSVVACGIDAYHSIEPPAGMDIAKVKKLFGDRITLMGNIDCADVLSNWTPDEIKEDVKRIIKDASAGGGHIFSSSNTLHDGVPMANAFAYLDAVKEYGVYR